MHEGDLTVHRDEIVSLTDTDTVHLKSGTSFQTDMIFSCTGYEKPYRSFGEELRLELGLTYGEEDAIKWAKLEAQGEVEVDRLLPILKNLSPEAHGDLPAAKDDHSLHGPSRHYRRLVPPSRADQKDRTIFFPGMVHSIFTPLIAETQALWGSAYMLGYLDLPSEDTMDMEVATFNVWTRKRYLAQGRKHSYAIFDFLSVCCRTHSYYYGPKLTNSSVH
jgi:dimethylaniline monooxygenase (N-oxide forming)